MATESKDFKVKNGIIVGGTGVFNGTVTVATPTENSHAATKQYVDENSGSGSITVSDTPPESASQGDLWFDSSNGTMYVYYDSFWVENSSGAEASVLTASAPLSIQNGNIDIDLSGYVAATSVGEANGVALLDENGQVVPEQLGNVEIKGIDLEASKILSYMGAY